MMKRSNTRNKSRPSFLSSADFSYCPRLRPDHELRRGVTPRHDRMLIFAGFGSSGADVLPYAFEEILHSTAAMTCGQGIDQPGGKKSMTVFFVRSFVGAAGTQDVPAGAGLQAIEVTGGKRLHVLTRSAVTRIEDDYGSLRNAASADDGRDLDHGERGSENLIAAGDVRVIGVQIAALTKIIRTRRSVCGY